MKPYCFPIQGAIDGWSRKITWLKVCWPNNFPEIPASFCLDCVKKHNGCPEKMRTRNGTGNGTIALMQSYFRKDVKAHVYGKSTANRRQWSHFRQNRSTWWIYIFKDLEEFFPGNEVQMEALCFCFAVIIIEDFLLGITAIPTQFRLLMKLFLENRMNCTCF